MCAYSKRIRSVRGTTSAILAAAQEHRREPTPAEEKLWAALQDRKLAGLKFRPQHPVGSFILDFYCPSCRLGIELDGPIHDSRHEYDEARTAHLNTRGYQILRFKNEEVITSLSSVLKRILSAARDESPLKGTATEPTLKDVEQPDDSAARRPLPELGEGGRERT
jgi:very-short-patch-repair endonuclease